jgi:hypothetical protein
VILKRRKRGLIAPAAAATTVEKAAATTTTTEKSWKLPSKNLLKRVWQLLMMIFSKIGWMGSHIKVSIKLAC